MPVSPYALVHYHELTAQVDGLVYFVPASDDKTQDLIRKALIEAGGARAEGELEGARDLDVGEAKVLRAYHMKAPFIVATPAPYFDPQTRFGADALAGAIRSCLNAANEYGLTSLCFGSWSLGRGSYPLNLAAAIVVRTIGEWRRGRKKPTLRRIVLAIHEDEVYAAFRLIRDVNASSSLGVVPNVSGEDKIWKVESVLV